MVKEIDGCLTIAYPLTEGIVKTIQNISRYGRLGMRGIFYGARAGPGTW